MTDIFSSSSRTRVVLAALLSVGYLTVGAQATPPRQFTLQGRVTASDGTPIGDGDHAIVIRIYDVPAGGTSLWTSDTLTLTATKNGFFTLALGTDVAIPDSVVLGDSIRYVGVDVDAGGEFSPRIKVGSTPFALQAQVSDTAAHLATMGASTGQVLKWDGADWVPGDESGIDSAAADARYVRKTGDTVTGNLTVLGNLRTDTTLRYIMLSPASYSITAGSNGLFNNGFVIYNTNLFQSVDVLAPFTLPHGAELDEIRVYVQDSSAESNISASVATPDTNWTVGGYFPASTSGAPGRTVLFPLPGPVTVNSSIRTYFVHVSWITPFSEAGNLVQLGVIRIRYKVVTPQP
jgi:hypothetical protein